VKSKDTAIVLHRLTYSNSSLIVSLFTKENGLIKLAFQGGKKKASTVFPLSVCEITFYHRPDSELGKLTEVVPLVPLYNILGDPIKSVTAFFISDVIRKCVGYGQTDLHLYEFLRQKINLLELSDNLSMFNISFLLELTLFLGIEPQPNVGGTYFDLQNGYFSNLPSSHSISGPEVDLLQNMLQGNEVGIPGAEIRKKLFDLILHYYKIHIPGFSIEQSLDVIRDTLYNHK
jgi:DNA repair protein RecO (recombination protein O)